LLLLLFLISYRVGNRAAFSDSRSNFHTRVGYRRNVCRRRLASDLGRASDSVSGHKGLNEDRHDRPPGSPPDKAEGRSAQVVPTLISCPMAQTKPASSLAMAAMTTVGFLPRAIILR